MYPSSCLWIFGTFQIGSECMSIKIMMFVHDQFQASQKKVVFVHYAHSNSSRVNMGKVKHSNDTRSFEEVMLVHLNYEDS